MATIHTGRPMFEILGIHALHYEEEFFAYVQSRRNGLEAAQLLHSAYEAVHAVKQRSDRQSDFAVKENASRVLGRVREELNHRASIATYAEYMESIRTLFGYESYAEVMAEHYKLRKVSDVAFYEDPPSTYVFNRSEISVRANQATVIPNAKAFFEIVRNTPDLLEAMDLCNRARRSVHRLLQEPGDRYHYAICCYSMTRINFEMKIVNAALSVSSMAKCVRNTLGDRACNELHDWLKSACSEAAEIRRLKSLSQGKKPAPREAELQMAG